MITHNAPDSKDEALVLRASADVNVDGWCDCITESPWFQCGGCSTEVDLIKMGADAVHWQSQHWHVRCAFQKFYILSRASVAAGEGDAEDRAKAIVELVENLRLQHAKRKHHGPFESCTSYSICALANRISVAAVSSPAPAEPPPIPNRICDYRNKECAAYGQTVGTRWICNNHICEQLQRCWLNAKRPAPAEPLQQEGEQESGLWCDHCSADLNGVKHVLCKRCYREFAASINTRETLRAAILDWLAHRCDRAPVCGNCTYCRVAKFVQSLEPAATPPTAPSDAAMRAAEEIREWIGISGLVDGQGINEVAAIITRHLAAVATEKLENPND